MHAHRRRSRTPLLRVTAAAIAAAVLVAACGGDGVAPVTATQATADGPSRSFRMGFSPFPFAGNVESFITIAQVIAGNEDLAFHQFDTGVPWPQALVDDTYPSAFDAELTGRATTSPRDAPRYVSVNPLSGSRGRLASLRTDRESQPLTPPWDTLPFNHPDVITAFTNYAEHVIVRLDPDYFAYAIEANMLLDAAPERWPEFIAFAAAVYPALKAAHPDLPVFVTLQAEWFHHDRETQTARLAELMPYTDMIAVSTYGYVRNVNPPAIAGYFDPLIALAPDKPFAISESGWPAEALEPPFTGGAALTPESQSQYVAWLLQTADALDAEFVCWFYPRDFDQYWDAGLGAARNASTVRLFRDDGLWDGNGLPRPALNVWRGWLQRPLR
ncbi:MAG: hypothetical protein O3B31_04795 [Chloroflexi bacterium]|nr:hypothetical protein [Chloroflexota bacterium]